MTMNTQKAMAVIMVYVQKSFLLLLLLNIMCSFSNANEAQTHDTELTAVMTSGDIILGGLFPIHERGETSPCSKKIYNRGVQRLEAMLYAVDKVNNDTNLLRNIKIGVHILDTCSRDTYALNQSLQFVRSSINNLDTSLFSCRDNSRPVLKNNITGNCHRLVFFQFNVIYNFDYSRSRVRCNWWFL
jgi:metabotropic glutamate receptor 3